MRPGPLTHQTDEQLAALGRAGSDEAFAEIVRRYEPVLRAKCARIAGRNLADDALAQTWLQAFAALRRPRTSPVLKPWLHRVARNCAIDQLRARRQQESLAPPRTQASDSPDAELERKQDLRDLVDGLSTLPENQRDALVLREFEGWSYAQIAEWVQEPPSGIHQLIFRARSALRRGLCAVAPWTAVRTLAQHVAAMAPGGGGAPLRFGLAMIGAAFLSGGAATSGVVHESADRMPTAKRQIGTVEPASDAPSTTRRATSPKEPFVVLPGSRGPRTGGRSFTHVGRWHGNNPQAPTELVSGEIPPAAVPELGAPTVPGAELTPSEPGEAAPVVAPPDATPATDSPGEGVTEPPADGAPAPAPEEPVAAEPSPATGDNDNHPGRGHGPPAWAPAKGHTKHSSA